MRTISGDRWEVDVPTKIMSVVQPDMYQPGEIKLQVWLGDDMYDCTCLYPAVQYSVFEPNREYSQVMRRILMVTQIYWSDENPNQPEVAIASIRLEPDEGIDCLYLTVE